MTEARRRAVLFLGTSAPMVVLWFVASIKLDGVSVNALLVVAPAVAWLGPGLIRSFSDHPLIRGWIAYCVVYALTASLMTLAFAIANNLCFANTDCTTDPQGVNGLLMWIFVVDLLAITAGCVVAVPSRSERPRIRYDD